MNSAETGWMIASTSAAITTGLAGGASAALAAWSRGISRLAPNATSAARRNRPAPGRRIPNRPFRAGEAAMR